jgi:hypothetical protein
MRRWWMEIALPSHPHVCFSFGTGDTPALLFSSIGDAHGGNTLLLDEDMLTLPSRLLARPPRTATDAETVFLVESLIVKAPPRVGEGACGAGAHNFGWESSGGLCKGFVCRCCCRRE